MNFPKQESLLEESRGNKAPVSKGPMPFHCFNGHGARSLYKQDRVGSPGLLSQLWGARACCHGVLQ